LTLPAALLLALVVANACVLLAPDTPLASLGAGLLVLLLPGAGIVLVAQRKLRGREAVLWAIACSLAVTALLSLVLDALPWGITKLAWLISIDVVGLVGIAFAWREYPDRSPGAIRWRTPDAREILATLLVVVAVAVATVGVVLGVRGARSAERSQPFVQLWSVPQGSRLLVGARSAETGKPRNYRLTVFQGGRKVRTYVFNLGWGDSWQTQARVPSRGGVYRTVLFDADGNALRSLRITLPRS
jgi:hypothetical protein